MAGSVLCINSTNAADGRPHPHTPTPAHLCQHQRRLEPLRAAVGDGPSVVTRGEGPGALADVAVELPQRLLRLLHHLQAGAQAVAGNQLPASRQGLSDCSLPKFSAVARATAQFHQPPVLAGLLHRRRHLAAPPTCDLSR